MYKYHNITSYLGIPYFQTSWSWSYGKVRSWSYAHLPAKGSPKNMPNGTQLLACHLSTIPTTVSDTRCCPSRLNGENWNRKAGIHFLWPGPVFCLLLGVSLDYAQPIAGQVTQSKLRLCSANHRPGYWSNLPCDWQSPAWAYSEQGTENGPRGLFCWQRLAKPVSLGHGQVITQTQDTVETLYNTINF